ncbi:hypothetical protein [Paenibacillus sp. MBLB4367]|uniref:hypothetical protein n=1 Tax=Paenibacillus sp. MBLB4367 TaxID=3384767 RepID=UPI0039082B61
MRRLSDATSHAASLLYYNAKTIGYVPFLIAVSCTVVISLIFNLRFITYTEMAQIGELYLSLLGIMLMPHLTIIEDADSIHETVYAKRKRHALTVSFRILQTVALLWLLILSVALLAGNQGGDFPMLELTGGSWISAVCLGAAGMTAATFSRNIAAAYMTGFLYYVLEMFTKGKYTGDFYLFSLLKGSFEPGKWLLAAGAAGLLAVNVAYVWRKS